MSQLVIGVDPGPSTGIAWTTGPDGNGSWRVHALQCDFGSAQLLLQMLVQQALCPQDVTVQAEKFETGNRAGAKGKNAGITREAFQVARMAAEAYGARFFEEKAADAKPWATDKRLEKTGFPMALGAHARDAGRHMLRAAVWRCGMPDPLIRRTRKDTGDE